MKLSLNIRVIILGMICFLALSFAFLAFKPPSMGAVDYLKKMGVQRIDKDVDAPNFGLPDLEGKMRSLDEFRGQLVLLNFWATW
jgi:hypothetical protein